MAGDWIRIDARLPECAEVGRVSIETGADTATIVGRLLMAWRWADIHSYDGFVEHGTTIALVRMIGGDEAFWRAVERVGWLEIKDDGLNFPDRGRKKRRRVPSETLGLIYYISTHAENQIKIGYTSGSVDSRLQELQTGSPELLQIVACHPGTMRDERDLHQRFSHLRLFGEWFTFGDSIRQWIDSFVKRGGDS